MTRPITRRDGINNKKYSKKDQKNMIFFTLNLSLKKINT